MTGSELTVIYDQNRICKENMSALSFKKVSPSVKLFIEYATSVLCFRIKNQDALVLEHDF